MLTILGKSFLFESFHIQIGFLKMVVGVENKFQLNLSNEGEGTTHPLYHVLKF